MIEKAFDDRPFGVGEHCHNHSLPNRGPYSFHNGTYPPPPPFHRPANRRYDAPSANYNFIAQQADWAQKDEKDLSFILNKPNFPVTINGIAADENADLKLDAESIGVGPLTNEAIYEAVANEFELDSEQESEPDQDDAYCSPTCDCSNCQGGE